MTFSPGDAILFTPGERTPGKTKRRGEYKGEIPAHPHLALIRLVGDPFDISINRDQLDPDLGEREQETTIMATATKSKPKAKELRRQAKALGVEGWEDMGLDDLIKAVARAEKQQAKKGSKKSSKSTKAVEVDDDDDTEDEDTDDDDDDDDEDEAPAKSKSKSKGKSSKASSKSKTASKGKSASKAKAKDDEDDDESDNPYPEDTNLFYMAEALMRGGKVKDLVKRVEKKVRINPRTRDYSDQEHTDEIQRRLIIVSQHLRNDFGFEMEKEGRGMEATIRCYKD